LFSSAVFFLSTQTAYCAESSQTVYFQGYVGAASFDEDSMTFVESSGSDSNTTATTDLSSMPYMGFAAQFPLTPEKTHFGIDASLLFGWRSDDSSVTAGNGQARVEIDTNLWLLDLSMGLYAQTAPGERWRLYGAVGPMLLFGRYSDDTKEEDPTVSQVDVKKESNSDSAFGFGGYAKLGLEYALSTDNYVGIAVRGITTNLDFDSALDDDGVNGLQGFLTFTHVY
jgi:opacity protein-like surface antigen